MPHATMTPSLLGGGGLSEPPKRVLLVDDNAGIREMLADVLEINGFEVSVAADVNEALRLIAAGKFDVLLSDLQMPDAGDGLTVVSAMRHSNPKAVTLILSGYPEMEIAAKALVAQMDEALTKPVSPDFLVKTINERLRVGVHPIPKKEAVAAILESETQATIVEWLQRVDAEPEIISIELTPAQRSAHLPALFRDLIARLRHPLPLGSKALKSPASERHGVVRREQGYTAAMIVEESRMVQVSIFQTLQHNLHRIDFSVVLADVMTIADEVDSQLAQAMASYISESKTDALPVNP